ALREALVARLRFYRDIGVTDFYRRPVDPALMAATETNNSETQVSESNSGAPALVPQVDLVEENEPIPPRMPIATPPAVLAEIKPKDKAAALQLILENIGDCTRCALHKGRNKLVFADGSPNARLMFVGEGPGADEDAQGLPF